MREMTRHVRTTIRYDGPALSGHEMDVRDLAPALLALADIVQIANRKFNGDQAEMRVLVNADVEQKCFMIDLSLVQSILDQAKTFFDAERVKTAKEIAEWIGLVGGGGGGLFALLRLLAHKPDGASQLQVTHESGSTTINVIGDGSTLVFPLEAYQLAQDKAVIDRVKTVVKPLANPGYESLSFMENDHAIFTVDDKFGAEMVALPAEEIGPLPTESVSKISGVVRIKSPQYEGAAKWSLLWNGRAIDAEMTGKAADWVADFQANRVDAPPNTVLNVTMTETVKLDDAGLAVGKPSYAVSEVHQVTQPPTQIGMI